MLIDDNRPDINPQDVPCTCGRIFVSGGAVSSLGAHTSRFCPRAIAADHPRAVMQILRPGDVVVYPGTICEWPKEGPGSGRGPDGRFACVHCGLGHNDHGCGDTEIWVAFNVPNDLRHRICKIYITRPQHIESTAQDIKSYNRTNNDRLWTRTHGVLLEQEIKSAVSHVARYDALSTLDNEDLDARDFYNRLRYTLINMRRVMCLLDECEINIDATEAAP